MNNTKVKKSAMLANIPINKESIQAAKGSEKILFNVFIFQSFKGFTYTFQIQAGIWRVCSVISFDPCENLLVQGFGFSG